MFQAHAALFCAAPVLVRSLLPVSVSQDELEVAFRVAAAILEGDNVVGVLGVAGHHLPAGDGAAAILAQEEAVNY